MNARPPQTLIPLDTLPAERVAAALAQLRRWGGKTPWWVPPNYVDQLALLDLINARCVEVECIDESMRELGGYWVHLTTRGAAR